MFYANVYQQLNTKPSQTRLSFNCSNIDISIVDSQLSMLMRLAEIIMSLMNQQMQSNDNDSPKEQKKPIQKVSSQPTFSVPLPAPAPPPLPPMMNNDDNKIVSDNENEPGWISWAWSYVPSVTTLFAEDDFPAETNGSNDVPIQPEIPKESRLEEPNILMTMNHSHTPTPLLFAGIELDRISLQYKITKLNGNKTSSVPFIGFVIEKANITVEHYKPTSTTALDGQSVVSRVRKVKVSTSKISLSWDQRLCFLLSNVHFTLNYDRHVRMTHFSLTISDFYARFDDDLLIYPCQATLKLDHHRTYSLLNLEFSSLTGKINFNILAYLITVINQVRAIIDTAILIFRPSEIPDHIEDDIIYVDDLRNGSMKWIFQSSNELPNTNEIYFTTTNDHNIASCMTWKYPQRRSILKCHILPLPFENDLSENTTSQPIQTVECLMQYWHFGTKQFVTWQTFDLSDGQPLFLDFSNDLGQNPYSEMWRIVLLNASSVINQSNSLAASTRIDSLQSERYEPSIEMAIKIPNIRVHFMIDPQKDNLSTTFRSTLNHGKHDVLTLNLDNTIFDLSQRLETRLISVETMFSLEALEYRFLTKRSCIEPALVNLDLFIDMSKSSILSNLPDVFELNNAKYNQLFRCGKTSFVYQLHFDIDHINIRLSQSLCHLINILSQDWIRSNMIEVLELEKVKEQASLARNDDSPSYYTYYLFTNNLNCPVGLKQHNTTDNFLILPAAQTTDFVWSKIQTNETLIQFSLDHSSMDPIYSSPIDIHHTDNNIKQVVNFLNSTHSFYLQIHYDQHQIRRHINILGKIILKNLCNFDLNIKFYLTVGSRQIDLFLSKTQSHLSCLQTLEDIQFIQWNSSDKYSIDQLNSDGILSTSENLSIWIHLFQDDDLVCFIFTPIVIYRSYLTQQVLVHLNKDNSFLLQSNGIYTFYNQIDFNTTNEIYEHRLQQIDVEQLTSCIFELNKQSYLSIERIDDIHQENSTLIDYFLQTKVPYSNNEQNQPSCIIDLLREQHVKTKQTEDDIPVPLIEQTNEILNTTLVPTIGANGPAMYEPPILTPTRKVENFIKPKMLTTSSITCRIEPVRLYSYLNTILIELKPSTIVNNLTPFNFHLYANAGHDHIYIYADQLTCLSKLEYSQIQLILLDPHDGEHIQCQTIDLIFRNIPLMNAANIINNRLYTNGSIDLYFIKSSNNDYFVLHLKHEYIDHTHILTIESKYRFSNQTNQTLSCYILPISKQHFTIDYPYNCLELKANEKVNLYRFQGIPSTEIIYYLLFQNEDVDKQYLSKPIRLYSNIDESGNRQCFCLFKKDELAR